jgi:hypothetical protein
MQFQNVEAICNFRLLHAESSRNHWKQMIVIIVCGYVVGIALI